MIDCATSLECVAGQLFFFFFKQKTAYEILTCDWSSDVCSSDLVNNIYQLIHVLQLVNIIHLANLKKHLKMKILSSDRKSVV